MDLLAKKNFIYAKEREIALALEPAVQLFKVSYNRTQCIQCHDNKQPQAVLLNVFIVVNLTTKHYSANSRIQFA